MQLVEPLREILLVHRGFPEMTACRRSLATVTALASLWLAACTAGHSTLGTSDSACFKALPAASAAVHRRGAFLGVHKVDTKRLLEDARLRKSPMLSSLDDEAVCAVAFRGRFPAGSVEHAYRQRSGDYAVVLVRTRNDRVAVTFVLDRLPLQFRHLS
jgi:hypothetical protein